MDRMPWTTWDRRAFLIALDAVVGAAIVFVSLMGVLDTVDLPGYPQFEAGLFWVAAAVAVALGAPLAVRRLWPLAALAVVLPAAMAADLLSIVSGAAAMAAYALYMVARRESAPRAAAALAVCLASNGIVLVLAPVWNIHDVPNQFGPPHAVIGWAVYLGSWLAGRAVRQFHTRMTAAEAKARRQSDAERRLHLAREVHDVVAHNLSVITVKAGVALHVAERRPEEAVETLRIIERTGRAALAEVRNLVAQLRREGDAPLDGTDDRLTALPALAAQAEAAGVRVRVRDAGLPPLPGGLEGSIVRIVREAVTNVVKHAAPADCEVSLRARDGRVLIDVVDDGRAEPVSGLPGGHGLTGVRERVEAYGGGFGAGPRSGGGFAVSVWLPLEGTP